MALHGQTPAKIREAVRVLKKFKIGNVSGGEYTGTGRLPEEYAGPLREASYAGKVKYVLYSYWTPMAWLLDTEDGEVWVQPPVKYSVSTTGHQHNFAVAISQRERVSA